MDNIQEAINEFLRMKKEYNAPQACSVQSQQRNKYRSECLHIALAALREKQERERGCKWILVDDDKGLWQCSKCGAEWILEAGTPADNEMNYCPMCGRRLDGEI